MADNVVFDSGGFQSRGGGRRPGAIVRLFMKLTGIEKEDTANTGLVIVAIVIFVLALVVWF